MEKDRKLVLIGDSAFAEIAYEYFTHESRYTVVAFAVEAKFIKRNILFGLPVLPFENIETILSPEEHYFFAANVYTQLNRLRTRLYQAAKVKGFKPASFISPRAFVWHNVEIGEHVFVFEDNTVQPFVKIGDNVILWSGNHIGHHSIVRDNCFIASQAVISGFCDIGENCFIGVNATVSNNITIGRDCLVGAAALIVANVEEDKVVKGQSVEPSGSARRLNKIRVSP